MTQPTPATHHLNLRNLTTRDYSAIKALMDGVYKDIGGAWPKKDYLSQLRTFPEGQICIENNGQVVAAAFTLIVDYKKFGDLHTYDEITGNATLSTHDPEGDVLYGMDIFVAPDYRGLRLGRRLYEARKDLCRNLNLKAILAGGRIPGYREHAIEMTPQQYIQKVKDRDLHDPILTFQLANDFEVKRIIKAYLPEDQESQGYATLLQWHNLYYTPSEQNPIFNPKTSARIGCVQWQMRNFSSLEEMLGQVEYFVDALSHYQCDAALLPEFFNVPLMGLNPTSDSCEATWDLAKYTDDIVKAISLMAVSYNINIIAGSMPVVRDGELTNVSSICHRDGRVETQSKIHPTPHERDEWAMKGGDALQSFEMDFGKVGVLICYDIEFPELSRLLSDEGILILFVPFWTDTQNGYLRVRRCAQARAIENECYVAIAGSVGNLPNVEDIDINYAQSAVFSPSDFPFSHDAIVSEATPNTEMTLIVDLDFEKLKNLRHFGSVRNGKDRRHDLYSLVWKGKKMGSTSSS